METTVLNFGECGKYPQISVLLSLLYEKVRENGVSKSHQEELSELEKQLEATKRRYLRNKLVYETLCDIIFKRNESIEATSETKLAFFNVKQRMLLSEVSDLKLSQEEIVPLGMTALHLNEVQPNLDEDFIRERLIPLIDESLKAKFLQVAKVSCGESASFLPNFSRLLRYGVKELQIKQKSLEERRSEIVSLMLQYIKVLSEYCKHIKTILWHSCNVIHIQNKANIMNQYRAYEMLFLAFKSKTLEINCNIYQAENVKALEYIRSQLLAKEEGIERKLVNEKALLEEFRKLDDSVDSHIKEYGFLVQEIEKQQRHLRRIKEHE